MKLTANLVDWKVKHADPGALNRDGQVKKGGSDWKGQQ